MRDAANPLHLVGRSNGPSTQNRLPSGCAISAPLGGRGLHAGNGRGAVALGAVVLGTVPAGAAIVTTPAGAVVVGGEVAEVPGARGVGGADCPTTTPTDVLAPRCGWLPSRLASGRLATASTVVTAPIAIANTAAATTATRCQRIG